VQERDDIQQPPRLDALIVPPGGVAAPILPSAQLPEGWLPRVLRGRDLMVLCLFAVLLVTNVPLIAGAGGAAFLYWGLGFVAFLIPSALVCAQLYRLFPGEGAVYLWANRAFGSFWDAFLGLFCNWWPGAIGLTIEAGACITSIQALNANWLQVPWQQGLAEIGALLLAQALCLLGRRTLHALFNTVFAAYLVMFLLLGLAGLIFAASGHHVQGDFSARGWQIQPANYPVFATVIVSLLGMAVPLNLGAEVVQRKNASKYLVAGTLITMGVYLLATFAVVVILPPGDLANPAFLTEIFSQTFGPFLGTVLGDGNYIILVIYFICAIAAFNSMFARLLLVAGIDRRLPAAMRRLNAHRVPFNATMVQTLFNVVFVAIVFLIAPAFAPSIQGLSFAVFLVTINGASTVWNIAMIGLFLCGMILFARYARHLAGNWVIPPFFLYLACLAGIAAASFAMYSTFFAGSPLPQLLNNADWFYWVLLVTLGSLAVGAAYSFLVPEAEDLVILTGGKEPAKNTLPLPEPDLFGGDFSLPSAPSQYPGNAPGSLSSASDPRLANQWFTASGRSAPHEKRGMV